MNCKQYKCKRLYKMVKTVNVTSFVSDNLFAGDIVKPIGNIYFGLNKSQRKGRKYVFRAEYGSFIAGGGGHSPVNYDIGYSSVYQHSGNTAQPKNGEYLHYGYARTRRYYGSNGYIGYNVLVSRLRNNIGR